MNIYDTNESVELYDNRGIEMARKCIRRAKRECALRYLILLLLFALGMVDKILFPQIEIKLSSYILLYVICMFSMMGFRIFHNGIVAKRMKDFTLQEKHDYNLVIYRENHNKKFFLKSITLLTMAKQDILMEKPLAAKQALSQIAVESLGKNVLKTYYFLLAAASFRAREDSWQIELEHCVAVPSKTVKLPDDELQEIFRSGDQTRLMDTVKTWEIMAEQDTKTESYLNLWFGILMAATAVGYGVWTFVVGSSDSYYNFMLIGATLLLVGLWILVSVRIVYLLRRSQNKGKGLGKKKGIRFLTIFILVLMWCFIVGLSLVIFVGAGSDIHTQWEAVKTGKQQESQDEIYHNGTEISTEADIKNQETENTETASEIIEDTDLKPDQNNEVKSGPITDSEYASFQITADASSVEGFDVFDDYAETMEKNFIGTWYCPSCGMAFRIQEDGAYIYTLESENIGFCNQEPYVWELTDRSQQGLCPRLSFYYDDSKAGDMFTCYVAGCTDDYFWCNLQEMVWYRQ